MSDTRTSTIAPVRREVVVPIGQARAFEIFTAEMTSWWPKEHHIGSSPIAEEVVEPRVGGRWYTRHEDGSETSTGVVRVWEPSDRFVVTWQIGADWKYHDDLVTTVDVRFVPDGDDRTTVVLEHRDLDAYGDQAVAMQELFSSPGAWDGVLAAYSATAA